MGWLRPAWEASPAAVVVTLGPHHEVVFQNAGSRNLFGERPLMVPFAQAFPEAGSGELDVAWETGRERHGNRLPVGLRDPVGRELHLRYVVSPVGVPGLPPFGLVVSAIDLSGEVGAELAANRSRLLALLSDRMNAADDPVSALRSLTDALVPELADVAAVYVLPDLHGVERRTARRGVPAALSVHPDLTRLGPLPRLAPRQCPPRDWMSRRPGGLPGVLDLAELPAELGADQVRDWLTEAGTRNLAVVPLSTAGRLIGVLALAAAGDRRPYGRAILPFLADVAARAGVAVAQVRLHQVQARISRELQQALLPASPPRMPGVRIAACYLPGAEDVDVGGDWWDAVPIDAQHLALGVGDASGRGVEAAVVMGQARAAIRTASLAGLSPARVLDLVDRQIKDVITDSRRRRPDGPQFVTAIHAVLDVTTGRMVAANAGHLPLLLLTPDGDGVRTVHIPPGPPLGLGLGGYTDTVVDVPPGGSLLLFTDGLVEDRTREFASGLGLLATELVAHAGDDVDVSLAQILAALGVTDRRARRGADDIAAVLLRREDRDPSCPS